MGNKINKPVDVEGLAQSSLLSTAKEKDLSIDLTCKNIYLVESQEYIYIYIAKLQAHSLMPNKTVFDDGSRIDIESRRRWFSKMEKMGVTEQIPSVEDVQWLLRGSQYPASALRKELQTAGIKRKSINSNLQEMPVKLPQLEINTQTIKSPDSPSQESDDSLNSFEEIKYPLSKNFLKENLLLSPITNISQMFSRKSTPIVEGRDISILDKVNRISEKGSLNPKPKIRYSSPGLNIDFEDVILERKAHKVNQIYEVLSKLGEGAFGIVYKVKHKQTGQIRALKRIAKELYPKDVDPGTEYKILKTLDHPHILRLIEYWESDTHYFLISEYEVNKYKYIYIYIIDT